MVKKALFTLSIDNYAPAITALTFPLMREFAKKIRAEFIVIDQRKFPGWPPVYEKLQLYELAREFEWSWFLDADTMVHPEMYDVTELIQRDTVFHNGTDFASIRWTYDNYFRRDGRHIGSCNWCTGASNWCTDLWHPLEDLTYEEALENIHITINEENSGVFKRDHLIDDYTVSRNIARYGLKAITIAELIERYRLQPYLWHKYTISSAQKLCEMLAVLTSPERQPCFAERGTPLPIPPGGLPAIQTADGRIVQICGMGWQLMNHKDLMDFEEQWGFRSNIPGSRPPTGSYIHPVPEIPGWMSNPELQWLYEQGKKYKTIAEVGCWFGRSTHALLTGNREAFGEDGRVFAVDHFKGSPSERESTHAYAKTGNVAAQFMKNCGVFQNLHLCQQESVKAADSFSRTKDVDMVFIDGDHTYDGVRADLSAWGEVIHPKSMICGHDFHEDGVRSALKDYFRSANVQTVPGTSIWYIPPSAV